MHASGSSSLPSKRRNIIRKQIFHTLRQKEITSVDTKKNILSGKGD